MAKAFVMDRIGKVGFMDKPTPERGPNDAVVRTTRALICTSDSHTVSGGIGRVRTSRPGTRRSGSFTRPAARSAEALAVRAAADLYFDGVGSLKDMIQNHLLQLLCLIAMEPPLSLGERDLRDRSSTSCGPGEP